MNVKGVDKMWDRGLVVLSVGLCVGSMLMGTGIGVGIGPGLHNCLGDVIFATGALALACGLFGGPGLMFRADQIEMKNEEIIFKVKRAFKEQIGDL